MSKLIDKLDALYARTFDGDISDADRRAVSAAMESIMAKCNDFLTNAYQISPELRSKFRKLNTLCAEDACSADLGQDVLVHWGLARDLMIQIQKAFSR